MDVAVDGSRALAVHDEECPDIGPICEVRAEPPQQHHTVLWLWEARVLAEWGVAPEWAINGVLPVRLVQTRTTYTDLAGNPIVLDYQNIHHRNETLAGLGDPQLWVHHGAKLGGFALAERLGISIPLGQVQPNPYLLGEEGLPHEHIQFGTGTFDPLLGLDASRGFGPVSVAAFAQAQLPLYRDRFGYQAGARVLAGVEVSSGLGLHGPSFRLGATGVSESPERWDGVAPTEDGNQGRTDLFAGIGVTVPFARDWSASVDVRSRVWGQVVGAQLDLPLVVEVSIGRLFHFDDGSDEHEAAPMPRLAVADVEDVVRNGEAAPLDAVEGKWTVFDFWAPWCDACHALDARLRTLAAEDGRVALRRVNIVDFDSPIARQELSGVSVLPHVRLLRPDGTVAFEASGTPEELLAQIERALGHR